MKSEHRHELKTNDLAQTLVTAPDYVKAYGGRVLLGLVIVVLAIVLINQRLNKSRTQAAKLQDDLAYERAQIDRLSHVSIKPGDAGDVRRRLQEIRDETSDKRLQAEATVALGDYSWALANFPELPGAATEPTLRPEKPSADYLNDAKAAYQQVLDRYADQAVAVCAAHFGLAAVAENQLNWDDAKRHFEAIKAVADAPQEFKSLPDKKIRRLDEIRQPAIVGKVPDKAELPTLPPEPATTTSSTKPTTATATAPTTTTQSTSKPKPAK